MTTRRAGVITVLAVVAASSGAAAQTLPRPPVLAGCPTENLAFHTCALQKAKTFTPPRTPSGKPDFQGYWRSLLTLSFTVEGVREDDPLAKDPFQAWEPAPPEIVEPADRQIPYQPWAAPLGRRGVHFKEYIDPRTTCSTGGIPRLSLQDASQILQPPTDDHILWLHDDHHQFRVIAMDQRPAVGRDVKLWNGISRGRWEDNTLVVETTNLNGYIWMDDSGDFYTDTARLTERMTMIDPDVMHYEVTIEDPTAYTRPWKVAWALVREVEAGFELIEESCREGDRSVPNLLKLGRKLYFGATWKNR